MGRQTFTMADSFHNSEWGQSSELIEKLPSDPYIYGSVVMPHPFKEQCLFDGIPDHLAYWS